MTIKFVIENTITTTKTIIMTMGDTITTNLSSIINMGFLSEYFQIANSLIILGYVGYIIFRLIINFNLETYADKLGPLFLWISLFFYVLIPIIMSYLFVSFLLTHILYYLISKTYSINNNKEFKYLPLKIFFKQIVKYLSIIFISVLINLNISTLKIKYWNIISNFTDIEYNILYIITFLLVYSIFLIICYVFIIYNKGVICKKKIIFTIFYNFIIFALLRSILLLFCPIEYSEVLSIPLLAYMLSNDSFIEVLWDECYNCIDKTLPFKDIFVHVAYAETVKFTEYVDELVIYEYNNDHPPMGAQYKEEYTRFMKRIYDKPKDLRAGSQLYEINTEFSVDVVRDLSIFTVQQVYSPVLEEFKKLYIICDIGSETSIIPLRKIPFLCNTSDQIYEKEVSVFKELGPKGIDSGSVNLRATQSDRTYGYEFVGNVKLPVFTPNPGIKVSINNEMVIYNPMNPEHANQKEIYFNKQSNLVKMRYKTKYFDYSSMDKLDKKNLVYPFKMEDLRKKYNIGVFK